MALIPQYIFILFSLILTDYFAALLIEKSFGLRRKLYLIVSLAMNIGLLVFFKYFNFLSDNLAPFFHFFGSPLITHLNVILPIGLSFHTFQSMSYTIEVYYGRFKAERHLGIYAVYVLFFPQMVAGPIERPQNIIPQLRQRHVFQYRQAVEGLQLILMGMVKKVVVADNLALFVDRVYSNPHAFNGPVLILATLFFTIQIYFDFSAYSEIAIGSAKVMGINLMRNFNGPYLSSSFGEFWQRWHISLSSWFRDYVYIPLGGNRKSRTRHFFNILTVFLISGLWHGANWTYIVWGGIHGFYLILETGLKTFAKKSTSPGVLLIAIRTWFIFICVSLAWIFFRAENIRDGFYVLTHFFSLQGEGLHATFSGANIGKSELVLYFVIIIVFLTGERISLICDFSVFFQHRVPMFCRWTIYYIAIFLIVFWGKLGSSQFVYFQF